jgi:hypothetical protein
MSTPKKGADARVGDHLAVEDVDGRIHGGFAAELFVEG